MMLEVRNLKKAYHAKKGKIKAVDGINFSIKKGEIFGLLGPNGAGKTTTIKTICGLISPDEGEIIVNGLSIHKNLRKSLQNMGAVLEGARNIYWRLTAWENIMLFAGRHKMKRREAVERTKHLLTLLKLYDRKNSPVGKFSRGMQQKVALACVLVNDPALLLLDEPTLGLDVMSAETVKMVVKRLKVEKKSVLLTTHDMKLAEELCDRVAIIDHGKILINESVSRLKNSFSGQRYRFVLDGERAKNLFPDVKVETDGQYTFSIDIKDSDELYEIIEKMKNNDLKILDVTKEEIDLKEIFIKVLMENKK